jgi:hypothetical protein
MPPKIAPSGQGKVRLEPLTIQAGGDIDTGQQSQAVWNVMVRSVEHAADCMNEDRCSTQGALRILFLCSRLT